MAMTQPTPIPSLPAPSQITAPDNSALRKQLQDLMGTTTAAYNQLLQSGRDNDAFALRDALERFTRAGAQMGVNPWARTQAINDLRARMAAAAGVLQGTTTANALSAQGKILEAVGSLDATSFSQALNAHNQNFNQRLGTAGHNLNVAKFNTDALNTWNAQEKAAADAREAANRPLATPKTNLSTQANTPLATPERREANVTDWRWNPSTNSYDPFGTNTDLVKRGQPVSTWNNYNWGM